MPARKPKADRTVSGALKQHKDTTINTEATINGAIKAIQNDKDFPRLPDGVRAFRAVVLKLIHIHPNVGFEQWKPPTHEGGNDHGPRWNEAVSAMQRWWDNHTGFR